jgi:hypothetical protein
MGPGLMVVLVDLEANMVIVMIFQDNSLSQKSVEEVRMRQVGAFAKKTTISNF